VYTTELSLESELDPQYSNIDIIPGSLRKTNKVQPTLLHVPRVTKAGKLAKKLANCCDSQNSPKLFTVWYMLYICADLYLCDKMLALLCGHSKLDTPK